LGSRSTFYFNFGFACDILDYYARPLVCFPSLCLRRFRNDYDYFSVRFFPDDRPLAQHPCAAYHLPPP
jgi:hypothetical protein